MTFEYNKFKRDKSSIIPIEEIYTDLDINANDPYAPNVGYRFDSPRRWANDGSKNKSVGIRDLHLTPSSGDIRCRFLCYGHIIISGYQLTWNPHSNDDEEAAYENDENNDGSFVEITDDLANYRCFSDIYEVNITPQNNFEEIITNMMNFVNGASWKGAKLYGGFYRTRTSSSNTTRKNFYLTSSVVSNKVALTAVSELENTYFLKAPLTFNYIYDSDLSNFDCKNNEFTRYVLMSNHSASNNDEVLNDPVIKDFSKSTHYYYLDQDFDLTTKKDSHDTIILTDGQPTITSSELLLIIPLDDTSSIKAVYDLFNQKMPDINNLPVICIDRTYYVIPFVDETFISHFKFGKFDSNDIFGDFHNEQSPNGFTTNLKLSNVWDRIHLIYHASFSETRHRIIGRNGDHYDTPNKMFMIPSGDQDQFYLRFTTDGVHNILPIGCHFNVDLTFMLNPTKNTSTGIQSNHDTFRD